MPYSICCGVEMPMWPESDICPECKEHTDVEYEEGEDDPFGQNEDDPRIEER